MNNIIALTLSVLCGPVCAVPIELTEKNTVVFERSIAPMSVIEAAVLLAIKRQTIPEAEPVYFVLNSTGGIYEDSIKLATILQKTPNVAVICANCASGAAMAFIMQKNNRLVAPASSLTMHEMRASWFDVSRAWAESKEFELAKKDFIKASNEFDKFHYSRIGISRAKYRAKIADKEWVLVGSDIKKHKLADSVSSFTCDATIIAKVPIICSNTP